MSEPKYKTFRDLRSVSKEAVKEEKPALPSPTSTSSTSRSSSIPIAPERDFQRVSNSITREAMPQRLFKGKSKQVYDYLYHQTRGGMNPKRSIRKSRKEILKGSGLGSMVTVDAAVDHLKIIGLLEVRAAVGSLNGNEYEVFTPEEAATSRTSISSRTSLTQKVDNLVQPLSGSTSITQYIDNNNSYTPPKTSFKTNKEFDDEAAAACSAFVNELAKALSGREATKADYISVHEVFDVILTEAKIAGDRTNVVSSPSAFTAEHLRRRLFKKGKAEMESETKEAPATVGKVNAQGCHDCRGTGWWYPNGTDKGVAKCRHAGLVTPPTAIE